MPVPDPVCVAIIGLIAIGQRQEPPHLYSLHVINDCYDNHTSPSGEVLMRTRRIIYKYYDDTINQEVGASAGLIWETVYGDETHHNADTKHTGAYFDYQAVARDAWPWERVNVTPYFTLNDRGAMLPIRGFGFGTRYQLRITKNKFWVSINGDLGGTLDRDGNFTQKIENCRPVSEFE